MKMKKLRLLPVLLSVMMVFTMTPGQFTGAATAGAEGSEVVWTPLGITSGFNIDGVYVDDTADALDGNDFSFYSKPQDGGLPQDRVITASDGASYTLAPYTANNILRISDINVKHTLSLDADSKGKYQRLSFLATGPNGGGNIAASVQFTDSTDTVDATFVVPDWYVKGKDLTNVVYQCNRRHINGGQLNAQDNDAFGLLRYDIDIPKDYQGYEVSSIDIKMTVPGWETATICVFAVSGKNVSEDDPGTGEYTVSFDGDGGTPEQESITAQADSSITLPDASRDGFEFDGWYDGDTKVGEAGDSYTVTGNLTLKAGWTKIPEGKMPMTVSSGFNADCILEEGGSAEPINSTEALFAEEERWGSLPLDRIIERYYYGVDFKLAPYDENNTLKIDKKGESHTLAFDADKGKYSKLMLLATATNNGGTLQATVKFEGQSEVALVRSFDIPDWYIPNSGYDDAAFRVCKYNTTNNTYTESRSYGLYQYDIDIPFAYQGYNISSIELKATDFEEDDSTICVFAVSGNRLRDNTPAVQRYNVKFDGNGGSPQIPSALQVEGGRITLPNATSEGKCLEGWYDGDTCVGTAGDSYTVTSNKTLEAKWKTKATVLFKDAYGGVPDYTSVTVDAGRKISLPGAKLAEDTFKEWKDADSKTVGGAGDEYTVTSDITLYATWESHNAVYLPVTIEDGFNIDGVLEKKTWDDLDYLDNDKVLFFGPDFDSEGSLPGDGVIQAGDNKTFQLADYTAKNTLRITETNKSDMLVFSDESTGKCKGLSLLVTGPKGGGNLTATVHFKNSTKTYMKSFNVPHWDNYYSRKNPVIECGRVSRYLNPPSISWSWGRNDFCIYEQKIDIPARYWGYEVSSVEFSAESMEESNSTICVFAVSADYIAETGQQAEECTLSIDTAGGTGPWDSLTVQAGTEITLPDVEYDEDHEFTGWYAGDTLVGGIGDKYVVTADTALTAKWKDIPLGTFTVSFDADGGTPAPESVSAQKYTNIQLPAVEKEDHRFDGWYYGNERVGGPMDFYQIKKNVTLKAKWTNISNKRKLNIVFGDKHKQFAKSFAAYSSEQGVTAKAEDGTVSIVVTVEWDQFVSVADKCLELNNAINEYFANAGKSQNIDNGECYYFLASKPGSELSDVWDLYDLLEEDLENNLAHEQTLYVLWCEPETELNVDVMVPKCGDVIINGSLDEGFNILDEPKKSSYYTIQIGSGSMQYLFVNSDDTNDRFNGTIVGGQSYRQAIVVKPGWLKYFDPANPPKIETEGGLVPAVTSFDADYTSGTLYTSVIAEHDWDGWEKPDSEKEVWERSCRKCDKKETKTGKCKLTIHSSCVDGVDKHKSKKPLVFDVEPGTPLYVVLDSQILSAFSMEGFSPEAIYKKPLSGYTDIERYYNSSISWYENIDKDMEVYFHLLKSITHAEATVESPECGVSTDTPILRTVTYNWDDTVYTYTVWAKARQKNPPVIKVPEGEPYSFVRRSYDDDYYDGSCWMNGNEPYRGSFTAGETYEAEFSLCANLGYYFSYDVKLTLHNAEYDEPNDIIRTPRKAKYAGKGMTNGSSTWFYDVRVTAAHAGKWKKIDDKQHHRTCPHDGTVETGDHEWDGGSVTKAATTTATGIRTYRCKKCEATRTEVIPRKNGGSSGTGSDPNLKGEDGTALGKGASAAAADKAVTSMKKDADPAGSKFSQLQMKSNRQTKKSVGIAWKKVDGASKYVIYGNACGVKNKMKKLATVTGTSKNFTRILDKKVKKGTYYKFLVVALDKKDKVVSSSKLIHVATAGGKVGNHKSVTVKAKVGKKTKAVSKVKVKKGKSLKLKTTLNPKSKKLKVKKHVAARYESTNTKIATVNGKGVIKAKAKGTCKIYVFAQNGVCKQVTVTVK